MKKTIIAVCALLMTGMALTADEFRIPVIWKSNVKKLADFQTYAFGFLERPGMGGDAGEYIFVFQIKNLSGLMQLEKPFLTCYFNTDKKDTTGLYARPLDTNLVSRKAKYRGWDLQFNLDLRRKTLAALMWRDNRLESSCSFARGEFSVHHKDNELFIRVRKNINFKNIKFDPGFSFAQLLASPDKEKIRTMVETPQETAKSSMGNFIFSEE